MHVLAHYLVAAGLFVAIDAVWLSLVAGNFYKKELGHLLAKKPNLGVAAVFYILYIVGMLFFAVEPGLKNNSITFVAGHAALLGLLMYATYDLTNHSTLKNWPAKITVIDMIWGTVITTAVSVLTFVIFN